MQSSSTGLNVSQWLHIVSQSQTLPSLALRERKQASRQADKQANSSYIPQTEQHEPEGQMLFCLGNVTNFFG